VGARSKLYRSRHYLADRYLLAKVERRPENCRLVQLCQLRQIKCRRRAACHTFAPWQRSCFLRRRR
jgi:hypothetical protein